MAGPESRIVGRFLALARAQGWLAWKEHGNAYSGPGRLDVTVCAAGVFVAVEFKSATGRVTLTQADFIRRIRRAGGYAFVARDAHLAIRATTLCTRGVTPYMQEELELTAEQQKYLDEFEAELEKGSSSPTIIAVESPDQFVRQFAPADDYLSVDAVDDESDYRQSLEQHAVAEADGTLTRRTRKPRASKIIDAEPTPQFRAEGDARWGEMLQLMHEQGARIARLYEEIVELRRDLDGPLILSRVQR